MAEAKSKVFSIGTTPTFSHTKPPAKLANFDRITESVFAARQSAAVDITVSPAPDTSVIFRFSTFIWVKLSAVCIQTPFSERVSKIPSAFIISSKSFVAELISDILFSSKLILQPALISFKFGLKIAQFL